MRASKIPTVFIVGPTASGKTSLAIEIAEKFGGEIICADSRTIYKWMDIGTAKPTEYEQSRVRHWGLDLIEPGESFSAAQFKEYALDRITDIKKRGKIPFVVGGTGLYVDSILFDFKFCEQSDMNLRQEYEKLSIDELHTYCVNNNIKLPENKLNKRYIIRAIELKDCTVSRRELPIGNTIVVGIATEKSILRDRIEKRVYNLLKEGALKEANKIGLKYGWNNQSMTGNIYRLARDLSQGNVQSQDIQDKLVVLDWRLAKRQMTWLKRNKFINWLSYADAKDYLFNSLAKYR